MPVTATDLKLYKSLVINDSGANGGKESFNEIISATLNNVFPNVNNAERVSGVTRHRKIFLRNSNLNNIKYENVKFWIDFLSTAEDRFRLLLGTFNDTQSGLSAFDGGQVWTGTRTGAPLAGENVTGLTSGATGTIITVDASNLNVLVKEGTFQINEQIRVDASNYFTTDGTLGTFNKGFKGTGHLATSGISAGGSSLIVNFFDTDIVGQIHPGDILYLTDKEDVDDAVKNAEEIVVSTITWAGAVATITIVGTFTNAYALSYVGGGGQTVNTRIAHLLDMVDLVPSISNVVKNLPTGDYDSSVIVPESVGSLEDNITVTFTSTTAFNVTGTNVASYGSGNTSADFSPVNPTTSTPYFTLPFAGWSGTFAINDDLQFDITPPSKSIWLKEEVPAGASSFSLNKTFIAVKGDSEIATTTTTTTTTSTTSTTTTTTTTT